MNAIQELALTREQRRIIREAAGAPRSLPIRITDGCDSPHEVGEGFRWETAGGKPIYHPNAYRRAGGRPVYRPSTRCVEVGAKWIEENL